MNWNRKEKKKTKEKGKTSNHNTIKKQQLAREKGNNRDQEEYILTI